MILNWQWLKFHKGQTFAVLLLPSCWEFFFWFWWGNTFPFWYLSGIGLKTSIDLNCRYTMWVLGLVLCINSMVVNSINREYGLPIFIAAVWLSRSHLSTNTIMLVCLYGLHAESKFLDQRILFSKDSLVPFWSHH